MKMGFANLDTKYLRLDATNDPITGNLQIGNALSDIHGINIAPFAGTTLLINSSQMGGEDSLAIFDGTWALNLTAGDGTNIQGIKLDNDNSGRVEIAHTDYSFKSFGDILIDSDSAILGFGAASPVTPDYTIGWNGSDAVHTITAGDFVFTGGNVGIGTTGPGAKLGVDSTDVDIAIFHNAGDPRGRIVIDVDANADSQISFMENGTTRWSIGNDGTDDSFQIHNTSGVFDGTSEFVISTTGNVGIGTVTPDTKLQVVGDTKLGDDNTNYVEIDATGDMLFVGGAGLEYGGISIQDNGTVTAVSSAAFTQFVFFDTNSPDNGGVTSDQANEQIVVTKAGDYKITSCFVVENNAGAGHVVEIEIQANNGTKTFVNLHQHRTLGSGTDKGSVSICGIVTLAVNDTIEMWVSTDSETSKNVTISDASMSLIQVGG